jgi:hypothetical protein
MSKHISEFYKGWIPDPGTWVWRDGIPVQSSPSSLCCISCIPLQCEISKRAHQGTQDFAADHQPHLKERDVWHTIPDDSDAETSTFDLCLVDLPASTIVPRKRAPKGTWINTHLRGSRKKNMSAFEETPDELDGSARELCGVYHLVHSWFALGSSVNVGLTFVLSLCVLTCLPGRDRSLCRHGHKDCST